MNKKVLLLALALISVMALGACAPATPAATPEATEAATSAATEAATPAATEAAAPIKIVFWHDDTETEAELDQQVVDAFMAANPDVTVEVLAVPFDDFQNKYQTEAAAGSGPTVLTMPQDRMAAYQAASLLAEVPDDTAFLKDLVPAAVEGGRIGGKLYGVAINNKVLGLYYNKSKVATAPTTFDELLASAKDNGLAITADWFHNYMWLGAYGADLFDADFKAVVDSPEGVKAMEYLKTVCSSPGVKCDSDDGKMDTAFRQGEVAFRIQGPWIAGDAVKDLGADNVGVAKIPSITDAGDPLPWNQSDMLGINVNATAEEAAAGLRFIEFYTNAENQALFLNKASWIPANASVDPSGNPVVAGFLAQVPSSRPFPVAAELGATWEPMGNAVTKILEGAASAQDALTEAAGLINTANKK
jgi:arabinogalactan oligomer/maltooligosaccharide transport system substrate-binding protein